MHTAPRNSKSLRRRPPPPLPDPGPGSGPARSKIAPPIPPRPSMSSMRTAPSPFYEPLEYDHLAAHESPRPMGPKELFEYHGDEDFNGSYTSTPYPVNDPHLDPYDSASDAETYPPQRKSPTFIPVGSDRNSSVFTDTPVFAYSPETAFASGSPSRARTVGPAPFLAASRSPSPRKFYGRSPSLVYDTFENNATEIYDDEDTDTELPPTPSRTTHPGYINTQIYIPQEPQYDLGPDHAREYRFEDDPDDSHVFDYSMLPELPLHTTTTDGSGSSPTKRIAINSAISFIKRENDFELSKRLSASSRRKIELPPVPLDLPHLPFSSSSLVSKHFLALETVWSLNSIFKWCLQLRTWLHDSFIAKKEFKKALIKLLVYHKRDIPLDTIGANADQIISDLLDAGAISYDYGTTPIDDSEKPLPTPGGTASDSRASKSNPGVILNELAPVNGVLVELTSCYSNDRDHVLDEDSKDTSKKRCISSRCYLNRIINYEAQLRNTNINDIVLGHDWASHWKLSADELKKLESSMAKRQSLLFDLFRYEQTFIQRAKCFVEVVGPEFVKTCQVVAGADLVAVNRFDEDMVGPAAELLQIHQKSLFEPLMRILISNGKFIKDIIDIATIYQNWAQTVKPALLKYMATVPVIEELLKITTIKQWVDFNVSNMPRVKELKVNGPLLLLSVFNSRYQQIPLQLSDIKKLFDEHDTEYNALTKAIDGVKKTGSKVNEMKVHADNIHSLKRIQKQLTWKSSVASPNINLSSENRKFFYRGDLTRKGDLKINSSINHVILLDNYLFITEKVKNSKGVIYNYKVIETPIPIEFLLVELKEKEVPTIELNNITKNLTQAPQQPSSADLLEEDPSTYPFKVRFAGHGKGHSYIFSTKSERERSIWIDNIMKARTNLCHRLAKLEPYSIKLIANTCFAYELSNRINKLQVCAKADPIEAVSSDSLAKLTDLGYKGDIYNFYNASQHVIFSSVLSLTRFKYNGTEFVFVGLAAGVYCTDMTHEWKRIMSFNDTVKITVLSDINLVLMLSGGTLRYFPLNVLIGYFYGQREFISSVDLADSVSLYEIGKHREINMLFYAKKKTNSSATNFKVCIPETDNDGIFSSFKVVKRFYVQADCYGLSIFNSSFAVHTSKGIEILELDKLLPRSIPEIPYGENLNKKIDGFSRKPVAGAMQHSSDIDAIKKAIFSTNVRPMGMFKLANNTEFLLVYSDCAIFINKNGKLSRFSMLRFNFRAKSVLFLSNNLFLICEEVIEIWSISDFVKGSNRLIQVLVGKAIHKIGQQAFVMANPKVPGMQLVFELASK